MKNPSIFVKNIAQLERDGFVNVSYPQDLRRAVRQVVAAWNTFCGLEQEVKTRLTYSNGSDGVGYELKVGVGNKADRKENFDVALSWLDWLNTQCKDLGAPAQDFVKKAADLVALMKPIILDFAGSVEERYGVAGLRDEVDQGEGVFFVRLWLRFGFYRIYSCALGKFFYFVICGFLSINCGHICLILFFFTPKSPE
jgi:hypothetical protein